MLKTWFCGEPPGNAVRSDAFVVAVSEQRERWITPVHGPVRNQARHYQRRFFLAAFIVAGTSALALTSIVYWLMDGKQAA